VCSSDLKDGKKNVSFVKDYDDMSKDTNIDFTITFMKGKLDELENSKGEYNCNGLEKLLKLYTTNTTTNMHLFNSNDKLKKYETIKDIIDDYYETRLELYEVRKKYMIDSLNKEVKLLTNKAKYIKENIDGTIDLRRKTKETVISMLKNKGYDTIDDDIEYTYLVKMPMDSVTEENIERLFKERENKEIELENIQTTTVNNMWLNELNKLKDVYLIYKEERQRQINGEDNMKNKKKKVVTKGPIKKINKATNIIVEDN
jgi:DNA topoisomerase-2